MSITIAKVVTEEKKDSPCTRIINCDFFNRKVQQLRFFCVVFAFYDFEQHH